MNLNYLIILVFSASGCINLFETIKTEAVTQPQINNIQKANFKINYFDNDANQNNYLINFENYLPVEEYIGFLIKKNSSFALTFKEKINSENQHDNWNLEFDYWKEIINGVSVWRIAFLNEPINENEINKALQHLFDTHITFIEESEAKIKAICPGIDFVYKSINCRIITSQMINDSSSLINTKNIYSIIKGIQLLNTIVKFANQKKKSFSLEQTEFIEKKLNKGLESLSTYFNILIDEKILKCLGTLNINSHI